MCSSRGVESEDEVGLEGLSGGRSRVARYRGACQRGTRSMGVSRLGCHVRRGWARCRSSVRGVWKNGLVGVEGSGTVVGDVDAAYGGVGEVRRMYVEGGTQSGLGLNSLGRRMQRAWGCGESSRG